MTQKLLMLSDRIRKALDLPQIINITEELPHHASKRWPKRSMELLQGITVHHFASEAPIVNQALYHVNAHGWVGLAYTVVIRDGQIYQTNYLDDRTTHASGGNDISWGVCIGGDLSKRSMTDFERRALSGVCIALKELKEGLWVKGHNQISRTSCPCTDMNRIREEIMTAEQEIERAEDPVKQEEIAYRMANHVLYLQNMSRGKTATGGQATPQQMKWALAELMKLQPEFRRLGFLK